MSKENTTALSEELRVEKLQEITENSKPIMTGVKIPYKGTEREFNVYQIPLKYLVYNPYNGRIGTKVKTFEVNSHKLNPEKENDIKIIEEYLWDSKPDRNKKTLQSLLKLKQKDYGIVSKNGFIIDGNRRASILNRIYRERDDYGKKYDVNHCQYFNAIILNDNADQREILRLETTYQMGMDEKLDYNATEKYLKCKQLLEVGYSIRDIADMMDETETTIKKNLEILKLMDEYLENFDYKDMYSMLEKREGQFVDLNNYAKAYETKSGNAKTNWNPSDSDITDMLSISFDYIRTQYEGKEFRSIAQNGKTTVPKSIFASEKLWKEFRDKHFKIVDSIVDEPVSTFINRDDLDGDIVDALADRDEVWTQKVVNPFTTNLKHSKSKLENIQQADKPHFLLEKALSSLNEIDSNQESLYSKEALEIVKQINSSAYELKKIIEKAMKQNV